MMMSQSDLVSNGNSVTVLVVCIIHIKLLIVFNRCCGVVVITFALHAKGLQFDPGQHQVFYTQNSYIFLLFGEEIFSSDTLCALIHHTCSFSIQTHLLTSSTSSRQFFRILKCKEVDGMKETKGICIYYIEPSCNGD